MDYIIIMYLQESKGVYDILDAAGTSNATSSLIKQ